MNGCWITAFRYFLTFFWQTDLFNLATFYICFVKFLMVLSQFFRLDPLIKLFNFKDHIW